ncbi:hypothetical protein MYU51_019617 [Penicillium brevicompactum]
MRDEPICDDKVYSRNEKRPRDGNGERFIHSAVRGVEAVRSKRKSGKTRWSVVVPPWSYLRSGDRTPKMDVSQWQWAAPMYNGMKISNGPSPSQQEAGTRHTLATEPFKPTLKVIADLKRDDPKFAFPTARLVGIYRRLWESCVSKHMDGEKLEQDNLVLKEAGTHLRKERDDLQVRHDKQISRLRFTEQALNSSRERLLVYLMTGTTLRDSISQGP